MRGPGDGWSSRTGEEVADEHPLILDYAGPKSHGKMRLPARSLLSIESGEQSYKVVETLAGKQGAIAGMVFALLVLTVAAAEAAIGLALVISLYRGKATFNLDEVNLLKW